MICYNLDSHPSQKKSKSLPQKWQTLYRFPINFTCFEVLTSLLTVNKNRITPLPHEIMHNVSQNSSIFSSIIIYMKRN